MSLIDRENKRRKVVHIIEMTCEVEEDCELVHPSYHDCSEDAICQVCEHIQSHEEKANFIDNDWLDRIAEQFGEGDD